LPGPAMDAAIPVAWRLLTTKNTCCLIYYGTFIFANDLCEPHLDCSARRFGDVQGPGSGGLGDSVERDSAAAVSQVRHPGTASC